MKPGTFSNAMVATVGAYAEAIAELAVQTEQLQAALRSMTVEAQAAQTHARLHARLVESAREMVARAIALDISDKLDPVLGQRLREIRDALDALDSLDALNALDAAKKGASL